MFRSLFAMNERPRFLGSLAPGFRSSITTAQRTKLEDEEHELTPCDYARIYAVRRRAAVQVQPKTPAEPVQQPAQATARSDAALCQSTRLRMIADIDAAAIYARRRAQAGGKQ